MYFDEDLLSGAHARETHADIGAGAPAADFEDYAAHGDTGSGAAHSSVDTLVASSRRKRGSRGGVAAKPSSLDQKRWRSGAVPSPPTFSGDIEADPYCYRHYRRKLLRWVEITREFLPGNEQALRALENLKGEAEIEMEEIDDDRYNVEGGITLLLQDLERSFGAKEMFRQGGTIREFESVGRLQGESVHAFVRRFRLLERKLKDNQVPEYPEQARVIKLLDGLRLDEKSVASLLLAAGNRYDMQAILNAIAIQYPAGMTITGLPRLRADRRGRGRGTSTSTASTSASSTRSGPSLRKWRHWNTSWEDYADEEFVDGENQDALPPEDDLPLVPEGEEHAEDEGDNEDYVNEEVAEDADESYDWANQETDYVAGDDEWNSLVQSLTVTSKRLAGLAQARGYYQTDGKGKKGKGKGKGRGKGRGKSGGKSSGKPSSSFGKAAGKKGPGPKGKNKHLDPAVQQQRLQGSLCLGCGASDHWLKDCPSYNVQNAQVASAAIGGLVLDAEGAASVWTVSANEPPQVHFAEENLEERLFQAPPLSDFDPPVTSSAWQSEGRFVYPIAIAGLSSFLPDPFLMPPPTWLVRWRNMLRNLLNFVFYVKQMVIMYSATTLHSALKDRVLQTHMVPSSAATLLSTTAAMAAQESLQSQKYLRTPETCNHPSGMRAYGAAGVRVRICDLCGTRYVLLPTGTSVLATPKASPSARTPLNLPDHVMQAIRGKHPGPGSATSARSQSSWRPSSTSSQGYAPPPPPRPQRRSSTAVAPKAAPKTVPRAKSMMQTGATASSSRPTPQRSGSESDRMSTGTGIYHEDMDWTDPPGQEEDWSQWQEPNWFLDPHDQDHLEGSEGEEFDPNDLLPEDLIEDESYGKDFGAFVVKSGLAKRIRGNERAMREAWKMENQAYEQRVHTARKLRKHAADLVEIYGGHAEITHVALDQDMRVLQPVDQVHGLSLDKPADFDALRSLLLKHKPFLTVFEFPCTLWSNVQHLNYDQATLHQLRMGQNSWIKGMVDTILAVHSDYGGHFLLENPAYTAFWQHPEILRLYQLPHAELRVGHMCCYGLTGKDGLLLKKPTGWLCDLPLLLDQVCQQCPGPDVHVHGQVMGGNSVRAQVYTTKLAKAVVRGLCDSLKELGDERFNSATSSSIWQADVENEAHVLPDLQPAGEDLWATVYFLDVNRHEDSWLALLKEAEAQLKDKVLQAGAQHRGAALWLSDGSVVIEAESVSRILVQSAGRFTSPVRVAVFFFGTAPATSLNEAENEQPETQVKKVETDEVEETEVMRPHQPGFRDITFPGLKGAPKWLLQVMRRLHTNLGHPSTPTMVRHLSASGASEAAIQAARHLRCEVCLRVQPPRLPRPAKAFTPRRFNDRLNLDVLWLKDISGRAHGYLSQVDEATCYHVLNYMRDRTEEETMRLLVNGWFAFFGPPDEMLLDSDGSFRGFRFETLQAQCAVRIRYAPADAHYQMGKVERHGQSIRYIVQRLVSQFAPLGAEELNLIVTMAASAKNSLLRRSGSSPAQWVFGRNPKLPGSLLSSGGNVESCSLYNDSDRLRLVEQIRTKAMMLYHQFESDAALRAALLRKPRPARGPFSEGQRVAYYRFRNTLDGEGTAEGYRQGIIVALDGSTLWIRNNRGRLISASKEQVRAVGGEEEWWAPSQSDLDLLKKSDQDLSEKHSTLAFRAPPGPQASDDQAVVAELDFQLRAQSPAPRALLDQSGQPVLDAEGLRPISPVLPEVSGGHGQDSSRQVSSESAAVKRSSLGTSELQRDLERLMEQVNLAGNQALRMWLRLQLPYFCFARTAVNNIVSKWMASRIRPTGMDRLMNFNQCKRNCLGTKSQGFLSGLYSHGGFSGISKASKLHRHLTSYVLEYMRHHGMRGQATSIYISKNAAAKCHRDLHNLHGSLNWVTSVGSFEGGELWVECKSADPPPEAVYRTVGDVQLPGFVTSAKDQVYSFRPDCYHETQPFHGERYSVVVYTSRLLPEISTSIRRRLQRMGFLLSPQAAEVCQVGVEDLPPWLHEAFAEAYPARAWQPPGEGETLAMDTSGDDAHDGAQEPPSRAQRQALKKELPWQAMSEAEIPQFVQAVLDEWTEWRKWSSCRPIWVDLEKIAVPEWSEANLLYKLSAPVYGQANAPRRWYVHVARTLTGLGWTAHTLDPCLWLLREECDGVLKITGVLGVHVDDMIMSVLPGREAALEALRGSFEWGSAWETKEFTFVGRHIKQHDDWSLTVDQASYVAEVPITKISMPPDEKLSDHPELITEFRSGIGSLQWMAGTTRGDIAADTSLLQKPPGELTVADLLEVNSMLRYVRATSDAYYKLIPIDFEDMLLIAYGDSAWANAPGGKSQGGLVVVATSKQVLQLPQRASLLEWKSYRHQRVLRSTLAAEAASLDKAEDYGNFLATMLSEMVDGRYSATLREVPLIEVVPVTDARSLWDAIHRLSTSFAEKRVEISIATLRQQCRALRWVPTEQQLADVLTKRSRSLRDAFRNWMSDPWITLVESRSPTDIDPNGANAAWR
ncbi:RE1 [Symbiodinium microadriaticum]|nr:RE1 [Symbiodinium microadriaticum]